MYVRDKAETQLIKYGRILKGEPGTSASRTLLSGVSRRSFFVYRVTE